ncbi:helix-turn-helix transcriptional regulator [uncultured Sphingomonas sp.]|uniref:helix-turn-helix transcriptional regulator n=1 Tax=uncultured Sphingomonas sp. TaxID=158754 RepID=UPI0035C9EAE1
MDAQAIVERFRSAALGIDDWCSALDALAVPTRARIGQICVSDARDGLKLNLMAGCSPDEEAAYLAARGPDPRINPRTRAVLTAPSSRCVAEADFATPALVARTPIYQDLFRRAGTPSSLAIRVDEPDGTHIVLSMQRYVPIDDVDARERRLMEAIAPGVAAAVRASLALGTGLDRDLAATLERVAAPCLLLGADMTVAALSPGAGAALGPSAGLSVGNNRLRAAVPEDQRRLERAFDLSSDPATLRPVTVAVRRCDGERGATAEFSPLPARMAGPLSRARALVMIRVPRPAADAGAADALRALFGLTPAEAEVAAMVGRGADPAAIARARGCGRETVRSQLKIIFEKTGARRQAELALLVRPHLEVNSGR